MASKNGLVASPNASAYCTAKASEVQLSRSVALEGAPLGIRCNVEITIVYKGGCAVQYPVFGWRFRGFRGAYLFM